MRDLPSRRGWFALLALLVLAAMVPGVAAAQQQPGADERPTFKPRAGGEFVPGEVIVKFEESAAPAARSAALADEGLRKKEDLELIGAEVHEVEGQSVEQAVRDLNRRPDVEYAQPNLIYRPSGYADEPQFGQLWGLHNTGQTINGSPGIANVDVNGLEASNVTQGDPNLVVAVIDDGVDFAHPDLASRKWVNPGESGSGKETNGIDDDGNGYVDDVNGWDFHNDDKTVHDADDFHGTHVSGTIAASVNGQGVTGVAPNVKIMALKFIGPNGGDTADAIEAINYAKDKGVKISNNSWGCFFAPDPGLCYDQALKDAIDASGSLFVAAAGNDPHNNDVAPTYPASYDSANILSVAAINNQGNLAGFSSYGTTSVDISAPGVDILSSVPGVPDQSAVTLSSVGASGKALTAGFGADEIGAGSGRASFFTKAFDAVGRGSQPVVLVDDDQSHAGAPDVGATLSAAIQSATGSAPTEIDVADGDGSALAQLSGKTVVWATGQASTSGSGMTTLTANDQATLTDFLNGGGKLVLTGMDALWLIENSPFVTSTLKLNVQSDTGGDAFTGSSGAAFAGESYTFDSPTAFPPFHDKVEPATGAAVTQGVYPGAPASWESWNGTSMATPHATGAAALVASVNPGLLNDPVALKNLLMDSGKPVPATAGKTVTGDMIDAKAALDAGGGGGGGGDTTPPTVESTTPSNGATGVRRVNSITATFSEQMNASTLSTSTVKLRNTKTGQPVTDVAVTSVVNSAGKTAVTLNPFPSNPTAKLAKGTVYEVTIKGAGDADALEAEDLAGNALATDKVWTFRTGKK